MIEKFRSGRMFTNVYIAEGHTSPFAIRTDESITEVHFSISYSFDFGPEEGYSCIVGGDDFVISSCLTIDADGAALGFGFFLDLANKDVLVLVLAIVRSVVCSDANENAGEEVGVMNAAASEALSVTVKQTDMRRVHLAEESIVY
eukprot:CAMPEP_0194085764 /NCGR_PEP_ID=MMETSP0149-20130528/18686_1 /TAXON_ID=122233 /ORGANISM="Chaetoceros debilis, Strain MM31A-1" /LENGTH=144 /DNA_ID=CAMNT_0038768717 /DNA_START=294 /DNA_END=729 /DNA_ORIENTATION=+